VRRRGAGHVTTAVEWRRPERGGSGLAVGTGAEDAGRAEADANGGDGKAEGGTVGPPAPAAARSPRERGGGEWAAGSSAH